MILLRFSLRILAAVAGLALVVALGCHSTPLKAPPGSNINAENKWLKDYQWARAHQASDSEKSCTIFTSLGSDKKFPAHDIARLRALETCPNENMPQLDRAQWPPYLQELAVDILVKLAGDRGDKTAEMELAVEKSKQRLPQNVKIKWMNLALQRAEELKAEERLAELQKRLYSISPRLNPQPEEKEFLSVANDLRLARKFEKAREYYQKVLGSKLFDTDKKIAALKGIRLSYKNARQNENHLKAAQSLIDFLKRELKTSRRSRALLTASYDAQVYLARALWTLGHVNDAEKIFARLEHTMKGKVSLAELYWLRGRVAEDNKDLESVSHFMERALKEKTNEGELRDKILWYSAWNERRRHNLPRAAEILQMIDEKTQTDFTRSRALFWLGRTYAENNQADESLKVYQRLMESDPLGYYGLLAHRQTKTPIKLLPPVRQLASASEPTLPFDTVVADWLGLLEEKDALTALLDQASQTYKKQRQQNDETWVHIFQYYARAGLYMKLYESLNTLTPEQRKSIFERHPDLLFPQPWNEDAQAAADRFGVEIELIYAIIRQESAFDTHARSLADAFGVMQLLPEVAEQLSRRYAIPYSAMEDLYDPKINMLFGAAHLKELFDRHRGQFIPAVAAYNANEEAIRGWIKNRFRGDALEFIEEIPYEETRAYVRLVMRNLIFYSLLKSNTASAGIDFPEWVLKLEG
jgi:soluble lytic murein transglycosylase